MHSSLLRSFQAKILLRQLVGHRNQTTLIPLALLQPMLHYAKACNKRLLAILNRQTGPWPLHWTLPFRC